MEEFWKSYGVWIVLGGLFLFMVFGHFRGGKAGMGGGCGMGGNSNDPNEKKSSDKGKIEEKKSSGGCH